MYVHYIIQDMKRLKAHELLEKETIKASALRHKLANLPHKLKAELAGLYMHALSNKSVTNDAPGYCLYHVQLLWHLPETLMQLRCTLSRYALLYGGIG